MMIAGHIWQDQLVLVDDQEMREELLVLVHLIEMSAQGNSV